MRKPFIAGNWKMYKDLSTAVELAKGLAENLAGNESVDIGVAPPYPFLAAVKEAVGESGILVGAQNMHPEKEGAFTGEVSAGMLKSLGVDFVIIGHSERRHVFGEKNDFINEKVRASIDAGFLTILCVGETIDEREDDQTFDVVNAQLTSGLKGVEDHSRLVIAYEPVWAIGTGRTATPEIAEDVHSMIRNRLSELMGAEAGMNIRIQYGGSVKPDNVSDLMACENIDGALVGGASLKVDSFSAIVKFDKEG